MKRLASMAAALAACCATAATSKAQSGNEFHLALRASVVAIETEWPDGAIKDGFGFVVGQQGSTAYIATALHVLRGAGPEEEAVDIAVRLFDRATSETFNATLQPEAAPSLDLGVITMDWPADASRTTVGLAPADQPPQRGDNVWFIGRDRDWYVPTSPGRINRVSSFRRQIYVDDLPVRVGSSGAPLLAENGIVGMIIRSNSADEAVAVPISAIHAAFEEWRLPWGLVDTMDVSASGDVSPTCHVLQSDFGSYGPIDSSMCFANASRSAFASINIVYNDRIVFTNARGTEITCGPGDRCSFGWSGAPKFAVISIDDGSDQVFLTATK